MAVGTVRRLAAEILGVGESRVVIKPEGLSEVAGAMTREDVRQLIEKGLISKKPKKGRRKKERKKKRGPGSKKGKRFDEKEEWMKKVRSQRKLLRILVEKNILAKEKKREIYLKIKSGMFRSKRALIQYLKDNELIAQDFDLEKVRMDGKSERS